MPAANPPPTPSPASTADRPRPNIVLIIVDQMRGDYLGADGNPYLETPHLDHLAAQGTRFRHAYTACPSCIPARSTLMTGLSQWHTGVLGMGGGQRQMPSDFPHTLAGELSAAGYTTKLVGKGHFSPQMHRMGFENVELDESSRQHDIGFRSDYRQWFDHAKGPLPVDVDDHGISYNSWCARPYHTLEQLHPTAWTATRARDFLRHRDHTRPFFLNISFARPHSPYIPPQPFWDLYDRGEVPPPAIGTWAAINDRPDEASDINAWRGNIGARRTRRGRVGYCGEISFIDNQIGRFLHEFATRWPADYRNTLFLFTSDHGDMVGDHHLWRKTYAYEGSARVPFFVTPPATWGVDRPVATEPVELRDIMPTLLHAAGITTPPRMDGASVLPLLHTATAPATPWRDYVHGEHCTCYSADQEMQYVTDGRRKLIWFPRLGTEQYFDLEADPTESHDLSADPTRQTEVSLWRDRLSAELAARDCGWVKDGRPHCPGPDPLISPYRDRRYPQ